MNSSDLRLKKATPVTFPYVEKTSIAKTAPYYGDLERIATLKKAFGDDVFEVFSEEKLIHLEESLDSTNKFFGSINKVEHPVEYEKEYEEIDQFIKGIQVKREKKKIVSHL
jgi:hypothetical protein